MRILVLFLATSCLWAQADGITTSVSRTVNLPADEARFHVDVSAPFATSLNQVLEKLGAAGIRAADLTSEGLSDGYAIQDLNAPATVPLVFSQFTFDFTRAPGDAKVVIDQLAAIERLLPGGFTVRYTATLAPSDRSVAELKATVGPQLVTEAWRKAQTMADASGLKLGAVESVSAVKRLRSSYGFIFDPYTTSGNTPIVLAPVTAIRTFLVSRNLAGVADADTVDGFRATYTVTVRFAAH